MDEQFTSTLISDFEEGLEQYLAAAGSIVSVEARHAAILRDIISPLSSHFAGDDVVNWNGLDVAKPPSQVLPAAAPFIATPVTATRLP